MSPSRLVLFAALVISSAIVFAQARVAPVNDRPNPYQTISGFFKRKQMSVSR